VARAAGALSAAGGEKVPAATRCAAVTRASFNRTAARLSHRAADAGSAMRHPIVDSAQASTQRVIVASGNE